MKVLVIDDDAGLRRALTLILEDGGYQVDTAVDGESGLRQALAGGPDLILTDLRMPGMDGLTLVGRLRDEEVPAPVVVMTAYGSMDVAVDALRRGAADYIAKPFGAREVLLTLRKVEERFGLPLGRDEAGRLTPTEPVARTEEEVDADGHRRFGGLLAASDTLVRLGELARKVALHPTSILIQGPTGTGKELLARFIHDASDRAKAPFVAVNCGAIPDTLLESEFFGARKGAYTGADHDRPGLFEAASGGTLFLDEVGELPEGVQVKLLRVLQDGGVRRLGADEETRVDVRVLAATNRSLDKEVRAGRFREDLFYRLAVVTLEVPPLRERPEDLAVLIRHLLEGHARRFNVPAPVVDDHAMAILRAHPWPGNVRELENVLQRALILQEDGVILQEHLPGSIGGAAGLVDAGDDAIDPNDLSVKRRGAALERELIRRALARTNGHRGKAAELLELSDRALRYKIQEYGLAEDTADPTGEMAPDPETIEPGG